MHGWKTFATMGWMLAFVWLGGPAWSQSRPYLIFFDFQQPAASEWGLKIAAEIKKALKPNARVTIAGYTDNGEKDPDKLSLTRALAVQKLLVDLGVPGGTQLTVVGRGAAQPLVKTKPNEKEPQNRVVITTVD